MYAAEQIRLKEGVVRPEKTKPQAQAARITRSCMAGDFSMISCSKDMKYDDLARAEIQLVLPAAMPLYDFLVERHAPPFDQGSGNPRHVLKDIKEALILAGVRPAVWRLLCKFEPWLVQVLTMYAISEINRNIDLLVSAKTLPTCPLVAELVLNASGIFPEGKLLESYAALAGIIFAEGRRRKAVGQDASLFAKEAHYVLMWVGSRFLADRHMPVKKWDADWEVIYHQAITHLVMHGEFPPTFKNHYWDMYLEPFRYLGLNVVPLDCARHLLEEAEAMAHCVFGYLDMCREGHSRIFSLRNHDDDRLATIELRRRSDCWRLVQVRSICNTRPDSLCIYVAREIERRYNLVWAKRVGRGE